MRPEMHHLSISAARADALFVSALLRSEELSTGQVRQAVAVAVREFGSRGCAERVAQEFGDHPDTAVARMRWARTVAAQTFGGSGLGPVHAAPPAQHSWARAA
jgi:UDP:flavonoid glycosyltransferase YjiC (YdhE family)